MLLTFILIQCGANTNTGVFYNICQLFLTVVHSAVATWWDPLIGYGVFSALF